MPQALVTAPTAAPSPKTAPVVAPKAAPASVPAVAGVLPVVDLAPPPQPARDERQDFDAFMASEGRSAAEARSAERKAAREASEAAGEEDPRGEGAETEAEKPEDAEGEKVDEAEAKPEDKPEDADTIKTIEEAREALDLAKKDPKAFAKKFGIDLFSRQFAALSDRESAILAREQQVKEAIRQAGAGMEASKLLEQDPVAFVDRFAPGLYEQLTRRYLEKQKLTPEQRAFEERQAEEQRRKATEPTVEDQMTRARWLGALDAVVLTQERYSPIAARTDDVEAVAVEYLKRTGKLLTPVEAADMLLEESQPPQPDVDQLLASPETRRLLLQKLGVTEESLRAGSQAPKKTPSRPPDNRGQQNLAEVSGRDRAQLTSRAKAYDEEADFAQFLAESER